MTINIPEDGITNFCEFDHYRFTMSVFLSSLCVFVTYWMPHAQGVFVKRKHHPKQRKKDKSGGQHNKLRCEWNRFVTVTNVHIQ